MTSVAANMARVREAMGSTYDETHYTDQEYHARVLDDHDVAIRDHERQMQSHSEALRSHAHSRKRSREPDSRFRFKQKSSGETIERRVRQKKKRGALPEETRPVNRYTAHPLCRPDDDADLLDPTVIVDEQTKSRGTNPAQRSHAYEDLDTNPDRAFTDSLFDALADDEGAATYWEGVYNQPIHIYPRPIIPNPSVPADENSLEAMTDEDYAAYVKLKMWERANPHLVRETQARQRRDAEREEEKRNAHKFSQDEDLRRERDPYNGARVDAEIDAALERGRRRKRDKIYADAYTAYTQRWNDALRADGDERDLITEWIAWPLVNPGTRRGQIPDLDDPRTVQDIKDFFTLCPLPTVDAEVRNDPGMQDKGHETRLGRLKAERFRWHPDKMVHRFKGHLARLEQSADEGVDTQGLSEELLKAITGVFQIVDGLVAKEREKGRER